MTRICSDCGTGPHDILHSNIHVRGVCVVRADEQLCNRCYAKRGVPSLRQLNDEFGRREFRRTSLVPVGEAMNMSDVQVGRCRCGGYGVLFTEAIQRETGRCHESSRERSEVERLRAVEAMARRYAMAMGHAPRCSGGTVVPRGQCNCGYEALTGDSGSL